MHYVPLGRSGLSVSRVALGCIPYGSGGGFEQIAGLDEAETARHINEAMDRGINFIDTANVYSMGDSERKVGKALAGRRSEVVLTSKGRLAVGDGPNDSGASRAHLTRAVEGSLNRLGTDYLDLYYVHLWDGQTPIRETIATANQLIAEGKIRYWGVSNFNGWQLAKTVYEAKLMGMEPPVAHQAYYTPEAREIEYEIIPAARDLGLATFAWSPLGEGLLTGKVWRGQETPASTRQGTGWPEPHVSDWERAYDLIELLDEIARGLGWSIPQVVLSWLSDRPGLDGIVIAARQFEHLQENIDATERELPDDARRRITEFTQLPAYYPIWHRLLNGEDRPEAAEREFYREHRAQGIRGVS